MHSLGSILRAMRESAGLARCDLAYKSGLSESVIRCIEEDTRRPTFKMISTLRTLPELPGIVQAWMNAELLSPRILRALHKREDSQDGLRPAPRGFERLSPERRREIARVGGVTAHQYGKAHQYTTQEASAAGKIGGRTVSADREHMRRIGRIGGLKRQERQKSTLEREILEQLAGGAVFVCLASSDATYLYGPCREGVSLEQTPRRNLRTIQSLYSQRLIRNGIPSLSWIDSGYQQLFLKRRS